VTPERRLALKAAIAESFRARRARREVAARMKLVRRLDLYSTTVRYEAMKVFNRALNARVAGRLP
jgi:hypothetical protein